MRLYQKQLLKNHEEEVKRGDNKKVTSTFILCFLSFQPSTRIYRVFQPHLSNFCSDLFILPKWTASLQACGHYRD
jgi:hypothetical protein